MVVIIRLQNGFTVAFYSETALSFTPDFENKAAALIGVTTKKSFYLRSNMRQAVIYKYDPYYLEVGNSDLRIEINAKECVAATNLGKRHAYYDIKDSKVPQDIFGTEEREAKVECYEVFQLMLQ